MLIYSLSNIDVYKHYNGKVIFMSERILDAAISFIPTLMPGYHPDAADINEALDHGVASCAARSFAAALLLRQALPNETLYQIDFGYSPEHGDDYRGVNGHYIKMGHAVTRLWVPEQTPVIVETYDDASVELIRPNDSHNSFIWNSSLIGYEEYLQKADIDVEIDQSELLRTIYRQLKIKSQQALRSVEQQY